jgi:hypothetical protein
VRWKHFLQCVPQPITGSPVQVTWALQVSMSNTTSALE